MLMHSTALFMDVFDLASIVSTGDDMVLQYLQRNGLVHRGAACIPCGLSFSLVKDKVAVTGYMLRCLGCRKKEWLTKDSFFAGAHLSLRKLLALMYFWASDTSVVCKDVDIYAQL